MPDTKISGENEYGLAEAAILCEPWLSATTLLDVLARPAVVTAAIAQPTPMLSKVVIRKWAPETFVEVNTNRPMPPTFLKSVEAVAELLRLPAGWNSYSARPIAPQNAVRAIQLLGDLLERQTPPPTVVPRVQGGIQLEWHTEAIDIEIYIDTPEKVGFFAEHLPSGENFEGPLLGQEQVLKTWVHRVSGR